MNRRTGYEFTARIVPKARAIAVLLWLVTLCSIARAQNATELAPNIEYTSAASVLALPYGVAAQGGFARIVGTVTLSSSLGLVVHDYTAGVWVDPDGTSTRYEPGDRIEVVGLVGPGQYSPRITAPHIRFLGHGALPASTEVSFRQLSSGQEDVQYVSIEGTIRAVNSRTKIAGLEGIAFSIMMPEGRVDAVLTSPLKLPLADFFDARVRVAATVMDRKNDNMQSTGAVLAIPDPGTIEILPPKPPNPFDTPLFQIGSLMRFGSGTDYFHPVRLRGVLTFYAPGKSLVLQDGTQAIEIFSADAPTLQLGDLVEAVGYPSPDATGPILRDAVLRKLGTNTPLTPVHLDLQSTSSSKYRFCLISMDMHLLRVIDEPERKLLLLEKNDQVITAEFGAHGMGSSKALVPGSVVRVSGVNVLTGETGLTYGNAIRSELLLRSLTDVSVVRAAPWWTTGQLVNLSIVLAVVAAVILTLLCYVQLKRWKIETVLHERERLSRDIHDTLAQSFTGIGFQLQVIRRSVANKEDSALHHVDVARRLVQFSHREARKSLSPVSETSFSNAHLLSSLKQCAEGLTGTGGVALETSSSGIFHALPGDVNEQMFHIGQEAIANAVRHASPTKLVISLDYSPERVQLEITDNGRGFTMSGELLGFGIRGMRRRASEIAGELDITSTPGGGTCVSVTVPVPKTNRLAAGIRFLEKTIYAKNKPFPDPHSDR